VISLPNRSCANVGAFYGGCGQKMGNITIGAWTTPGGRFAGLLSRDNCERASYDRPLFETLDCVVAPTIGSILPSWLLVVPRRPAVNFRDWRGGTHMDPTGLIDQVLDGLEVSPERAIWFEHGPWVSGSPVGCGVDYAHIHVLVDAPFSFDEFVSSVFEASALPWRRGLAMDAYRSLDTVGSYLIAGSQHRAVIAEQVESAGSQFFRRVVARLVDNPEQWNYNIYPHLHNVQKTIADFAHQKALTALL
jgi:ATP adenylyltransferase